MRQNEALNFLVGLVVSVVFHASLWFGLQHFDFSPVRDFEREVRKRFNLKEVDIKSLKTHVEALPVPSTKTFRSEQTGPFVTKPTEVESVRQSMQTLQLEPNPPGTPLLPKGNEPAIQMTAPEQKVIVSDTHEKVKQEIIAIQESKLTENRAFTVDPTSRATAAADVIDKAGKNDKRQPDEIQDLPGVLTGGEGDPLNASLGAAAAGIGLKEPKLEVRAPDAPPPVKTDDKPYESIEPWLNVEVFTCHDPGIDPELGFFHVQVTPKPNNPLRVIPKDVIFIIDASASITQDQLDRFSQAVSRTLATLNPVDRFNIVTFRDKPFYLRPQMLPVNSQSENDVRILLGTLRTRGATDLYGTLSPLMALQPAPGRLLLLCLMSDGKPTEGIVDSGEIINKISAVNNNRATLLAFGGPTANQYLLDLISFRNRGHSQFATKIGEMEENFANLYTEFSDPLLMNLQFQFSGADAKQAFPQVLPHMFQGRAVNLYGRYDPAKQKTFAFRLVGETYAEKKELFITRDFPPPDPSRTYMPNQWAQARIYHLMAELVKQDTPARRAEIHALGRRFGIKIPYLRAEK